MDQLNQLVQKFTSDVSNLIREQALTAAQTALGSAAPARAQRPSAKVTKKAKAKAATGEKRDPKVIAATVERLGAYIAKKPGQRIEQIGAALKMATKDMSLPIKKLLAAKTIKSKGQKRATTYFPK